MPVWFRARNIKIGLLGYRGEKGHRPHVHVWIGNSQAPAAHAKVELDSLVVTNIWGFNGPQISAICKFVASMNEALKGIWNAKVENS